MPDTPQKKSAAELLAELNRVRALLQVKAAAREDNGIPLLDDVVDAGTAAAAGPASAAVEPVVPSPQPSPLPAEDELQALIDKIVDREMPRIRLELKRVLRDELRLRNLLK